MLNRPFAGYAIAIIAVGAGLLAQETLNRVLDRQLPTFILLYPPVLLTAILAGFRPGLLATLLAVLGADYLFMPPVGHLSISSVSDIVSLIIFLAMGTLVSLLAERYRQGERQKRTMEAHRQQSEMMNASFDAIMVVRPGKGVESWNRGAERLYGYSESEVQGRDPHELLNTTPAIIWQEIITTLRQQDTWECELSQKTKDGSEVIVATRYQLFIGPDGAELILKIGRDVTEHKRAEKEILALNRDLEKRVELRTAELSNSMGQLAENVKELESFSYSVSHDLRAPLRHLDGFLTLLYKRSYAALDDSAKHYVDCALQASKRMGLLIDDLLKFSRLGRSELRKTQVDLNLLVDQVRKELEPEARDRQVVWKLGALPNLPADEGMLRQVLENLIANALKFTRQRLVAEIEIGSEPGPNGEVVIFVRDNGVGFDAQYYNKMFQIFQRLHSERDFEGTGIGLAIARRVVERHGGRIWAEGNVDQGAIFYFTLPS